MNADTPLVCRALHGCRYARAVPDSRCVLPSGRPCALELSALSVQLQAVRCRTLLPNEDGSRRRRRRADPKPKDVMSSPRKRLIVVGDRVLISPEEGEDRSKVGLYLPKTAVDNQAVQGGKVVATGPGTPVSAPTELDDEPWRITAGEPRYLPVQAEVGDFALFFRKAAVEISFDDEQYLVVPQAAILTLIREELPEGLRPDPDDVPTEPGPGL